MKRITEMNFKDGKFESYYAIVSHNAGADACYYLSEATCRYVFGGLTDAMFFEDYKEVLEYLMEHPALSQFGAAYIQISKATIERLLLVEKEAKETGKMLKDCKYGEMYLRYHTLTGAL